MAPGRLVPGKPLGSSHDVVQDALRRVGLPTGRQGAHTVRRSIARLLFDSLTDRGFDGALRVVGALLGHSSVAVTQHYLGVAGDERTLHATLRGRSLLRPESTEVTRLRRAE